MPVSGFTTEKRGPARRRGPVLASVPVWGLDQRSHPQPRLDFGEGRVDRRRKTRIVELDWQIVAVALPESFCQAASGSTLCRVRGQRC